MKFYVRKSGVAISGYEFVEVDGEIEKVTPVDDTTLEKKTGISWLKLPENPTNRKLLNPAKVDKHGGCVELTYKEPVVHGPRENSTPRKKLEDYYTEEEKAIIAEINEKARLRKEADKSKPLTELEKAQRAYEKALAKLNALKEEEA